ncbi:MAG: polysaccharide deacetylase family protein [Candidatus Saccharimonadales bacterium]
MQKRKKPAKHRHKRSGWIILVVAAVIMAAAGLLSTRYYLTHHHKPQTISRSSIAHDEPLTPKSAATTPPKLHALAPDYAIPPVRNGLAPVINKIPTKEPVVFLGIDDGANKQAFELQLMQDNGIKASLFLANRFIKDNPSFFIDFMTEGSLIEDHTVNHKLLSRLGYNEQKQEICDEADLQQQQFGRRPVLFRPPGGDYNIDTQRAAAACGMKAVVLWIAKANGRAMQYQVGHGLQAGDIVLMHFRPEFKGDMQAFLDAEKAAGLHTELLENWLDTEQPTKTNPAVNVKTAARIHPSPYL